LKSLNDTHGHLAGADAVRTVGHILAARLPPDAVACRYGGDEFVIALPGCAEAHAMRIAVDLRLAVNAASPVLAGIRFPTATLSISVGVACHRPDMRDSSSAAQADDASEQLFRAADAALYRAKASGRNHVWVA
jgi:diguanylate cyclase (GGDEF)-like protein